MPRTPSPPAVELGRQLKRLRVRAGISKTTLVSPSESTLTRLENGKSPKVKAGTVLELCRVYRAGLDLTEELVQLAEATHTKKWWEAYNKGIEGQFWLYLQREDQATSTKCHNTNFIPVLVQHERYIEAIHQGISFSANREPADLDVAKKLKIDRQDQWLKSRRPLTCVIGEAAFLLNLGSEVMEAQKQHLLKLASLPQVTILVTPFSAGRHELIGVEFDVLEFDDGNQPLIHAGGSAGGRYVPSGTTVADFYMKGFDKAVELSIPIEEYLS